MNFNFELALMKAKASAGIKTDYELCLKVGLSTTSMSNLVKGVTSSPKLSTCQRIASACNIKTSEFIALGEEE